jgi:hypothetical protein
MTILTGKTVFAAAARWHCLPTISLIAHKVALTAIIGIAVAIALGAGRLRRAVSGVHCHNFGFDTTATSRVNSRINTIVRVWY